MVVPHNANHRRIETSNTPVTKNGHFKGTIYQFYSKKQQKNDTDVENSDSELTDSSSQSYSEPYCCDIADAEIDTEKDVPWKTMFSFFKKVSSE